VQRVEPLALHEPDKKADGEAAHFLALYEYYFFGDPVRMAGEYVASYDTTPYADRVRDFLSRG